MVFYVCHGRVQVDISGVQFSAGKGCVFQVPRGEFHFDLGQLSVCIGLLTLVISSQGTITVLQTPIKKRPGCSSRKVVSPMRTRTKMVHPRCPRMSVLKANLRPTLLRWLLLLLLSLLKRPRVVLRASRKRLANDQFPLAIGSCSRVRRH